MLQPYQRIIGMGWDAVPYILEELQREPDHGSGPWRRSPKKTRSERGRWQGAADGGGMVEWGRQHGQVTHDAPCAMLQPSEGAHFPKSVLVASRPTATLCLDLGKHHVGRPIPPGRLNGLLSRDQTRLGNRVRVGKHPSFKGEV